MVWTLVSLGGHTVVSFPYVKGDKSITVWELCNNDKSLTEALYNRWSPRSHQLFPKPVRDAIIRFVSSYHPSQYLHYYQFATIHRLFCCSRAYIQCSLLLVNNRKQLYIPIMILRDIFSYIAYGWLPLNHPAMQPVDDRLQIINCQGIPPLPLRLLPLRLLFHLCHLSSTLSDSPFLFFFFQSTGSIKGTIQENTSQFSIVT